MAIWTAGGGGGRPKDRVYRFVDEHFLECTCNAWRKFVGEDIFPHIEIRKIAHGTKRLFYYDALPQKKNSEDTKSYVSRRNEKEHFLNSIKLLPNCHVREGFSRSRRRRGLEQKGVDIWLAVDVMQHAWRGVIDVAEIITGDLDFFPLFEALQQTGTLGVLYYGQGSTSDELLFAADRAHPIQLKTLLGWCTDEFNKKHGIHDSSSFPYDVTEMVKVDIPISPVAIWKLYHHEDSGTFCAMRENVGNRYHSKCLAVILEMIQGANGKVSINDIDEIAKDLRVSNTQQK